MTLSRRNILILLPLALLAACSCPPPRTASSMQCPPPAERVLTAGGLLNYHSCIASLPSPQLAAEYESVRREFEKNGAPSHRLRLALLLSRPDTPFYSVSGALQLLNGAPDDRPAGGVTDFAAMLRASLTQLQQLQDRAYDREKELAAEQARANSLQNKIDSIKDLERSMAGREIP